MGPDTHTHTERERKKIGGWMINRSVMMGIHIKKSVGDPCNPQGSKPLKVLSFCVFFLIPALCDDNDTQYS